MKNLLLSLVFLACAASAVSASGDDDLAVVVNKSNAATNLTKSQLRKLVLGEQGSWPGGAKVVLVLQTPGTAERDGVLRSVCRMTEDDYNQHLMHASFSGETSAAPRVTNSPASVRQIVASTPGAIAFLRMKDVDATVKAVNVEGSSAGQPDYKIKAGK